MVTTLKSYKRRCEHLHICIEWQLSFTIESLSCSFCMVLHVSAAQGLTIYRIYTSCSQTFSSTPWVTG
jgi:hypothetical protein